jgi:SPP1 gp7 family putative phage head morphogenesis protein
MKNSEYWKNRFVEMEEATHQTSVKKTMDIQEQFDKSQKIIEEKINAWYQRYADNNNMSLLEARKSLNDKELKELKWDVEEYIKKGRENAFSGEWVKELENASARAHISRLEALELQCRQQAETAFGNLNDEVSKHIKDVYKNSYYKTAFEIQKGVGVGSSFATLNDKLIEKVVNKPWLADGKNFSDRIWGNKTQLINQLHTSLSQMCITGAGPDKAISQIASKMNVSKANAGRLVMTESAYFSSTAQRECFKELDVERYEIVATLDGHTSDICQEMDGKVFKMSEYEEGVTAPPFHVNCRSCTAPYFDDEFTKGEQRAARDEEGDTYYVPADMTYKEWKKKYVKSELRERSLRTKRSFQKGAGKKYEDKYNYGVNWKVVKSKEYSAKFSKISDDEKVTSLIAKRSRDALKNRDGKKTEELYAISLTTGKDVSSITDQHIPFGINRTFKFDKDVKRAEDNDEKVLLIHNHPRGLPPSVSDLNELLNHKNVSGITVGSNGSIYYYSKPNDEINEEDFTVAEKHFKQYTDDVARYEKTMELLAKRYEFVFLKL